ncbi:MAG: exosortase-associated EpsI family protein [Chlamydiia bacterium]|nr:exosortase-associated EpsI family protein [Chlamydiia bacterium]
MKSLSQKLLLGLLIFACAVGFMWEFFELPTAKNRIAQLPLVKKGYIGREIGLTDSELSFFQGVTVVKRVYNVGNQKCFITILDGTRNRHAVHDPFYCYRGDGWTLLEKVPLKVPGGTAEILRMEKNGVVSESMYWFSNGQTRHASMFLYLWQATIRRLTLGRSGEEPIRITVAPIEGNTLDWNAVVANFPELFEL